VERVVSGPSVADAIDELTGRNINNAAAIATRPRKREIDELKALPSQESYNTMKLDFSMALFKQLFLNNWLSY
jgi:hypothetical protein